MYYVRNPETTAECPVCEQEADATLHRVDRWTAELTVHCPDCGNQDRTDENPALDDRD